MLSGVGLDILLQLGRIKGEPPLECIPCNYRLTFKHPWIECADFNDVSFYQVLSSRIFITNADIILEVLQAAALYTVYHIACLFSCGGRECACSWSGTRCWWITPRRSATGLTLAWCLNWDQTKDLTWTYSPSTTSQIVCVSVTLSQWSRTDCFAAL